MGSYTMVDRMRGFGVSYGCVGCEARGFFRLQELLKSYHLAASTKSRTPPSTLRSLYADTKIVIISMNCQSRNLSDLNLQLARRIDEAHRALASSVLLRAQRLLRSQLASPQRDAGAY